MKIFYNSSMSTKKKKKKAAGPRRSQPDSAWKELIEKYFQEFLAFFFPSFHEVIDFTHPVEFLQQEFHPFKAGGKRGRRLTDLLVKVRLLSGISRYISIFIHVEVHGYSDIDFMERIYIYNYRAFDFLKDKTDQVISMAVLTDTNRKFRPEPYMAKFLGFELKMTIPYVKTLDYRDNPEMAAQLEASDSLVALALKVQLKSQELKKESDVKRLDASVEFMRACYQKGYSKDKIHAFMNFLEMVLVVPDQLKQKLTQEIHKIEEEKKVAYMNWIEREAKKEGIDEGIKIGEKKSAKRFARLLLKEGIPLDKVISKFGLSPKEIEKLMASVSKKEAVVVH